MKILRRVPHVALSAVLTPFAAFAVVDAQIDTFESGTTAGWSVGIPHPTPPENVASGGPEGVDDNYLELESIGGTLAGSRLSSFNAAQWSGDYATAGIGAILMEVSNFGATDLSLRLVFADAAGQFPTNSAISADPIVVPTGSGWVTVVFPILPADLTALAGSVSQALSNTARLSILHNGAASLPPPPIVAVLGVDNIQALPEPSAPAALGVGLALLALLSRHRVKRS